ncbi:hypothetical protein CRYUN_Cryun13aG0023400 [Craigia yunnanensis]
MTTTQSLTLYNSIDKVRDEEGRRRFHGAFTGGFSAGYYNTVGTKEGWAPQSFTSSRKNRAAVKQQSAFIFLDEDEKAELEGQYLGTSSQLDTFGFTAAEYARKQADKEQKRRGYSGLDLMGNLMTLSTVIWCDRDRYDPQQSVILHVLKQNQKAPKRELGIIDVGPFN